MTTQAIIGACIRLFREKAGLTQEKLASQANISYQYLSGIETGKENFTIQVLDSLASVLKTPLRNLIAIAFENANGIRPPTVNPAFFRRNVPLPDELTFDHLEATLNHTQEIIHRINRNMQCESGCTLQSLIQGNNFLGLVSNILSNSFDTCSPYKHNHHQRYPDLINAYANRGTGEGIEIKTTVNIGKGGESHNGHDGWHVIACYNFIENGDIQFVHVMFVWLNNHQHAVPDWKYVGSKVNETTGSRRTETFNTTPLGTTKLRDGSAYLDTTKVNFSRWRNDKTRNIPVFSIWAPPAA
jgi:transcriptional regulator with XRE-family HTH domain